MIHPIAHSSSSYGGVEDSQKHAQSGLSESRCPCLDGLLTLGLYFLHLCGQTAHVILEPAGHVHVMTTHTLQGSIVCRGIPVIEFAEGEQALEVVVSTIHHQRGQQPSCAAIAIDEGVDVHQLELCYATHQDHVETRVCVEPFHEIGHQRLDFLSRWRSVHGFLGHRIDDQILTQPILAGCCRASTHVGDQPFVDLADQRLSDGLATADIFSNQLKSGAVVEQFTHVVRVGLWYRLPSQQLCGLLKCQLGALNVRRIVCFQSESVCLHVADPVVRQVRSRHKTNGALDTRQIHKNCIADREFRLKHRGLLCLV